MNDGSPDDTAAVLRPLIEAGRIHTFIDQENAGQGAARNRGIAAAGGQYIALLDDDDLWPEDKLEWQVARLEQNPRVGVVYGWPAPIDADDEPVVPTDAYGNPLAWPWNCPTGDIYRDLTHRCWLVSPGQALVRRAALANPAFDPDLRGCDDWDLWLRLAENWEFHFEDRPALFYRMHGGNASRDTLKMRQNEFKLLHKHLIHTLSAGNVEHFRWILYVYRQYRKYTPSWLLEQVTKDLCAGDIENARKKLQEARKLRPALANDPEWQSLIQQANSKTPAPPHSAPAVPAAPPANPPKPRGQIGRLRVSVIIPTYNRASYLPETLQSLLRQTRPADEILVVDDGSTDNTAEVVAQFHPAVTYIRQENRGVNAAREVGQEQATGDALLFIDSDDLLLPDALRRMEQALWSRPAAPLVFCRAQIIDEESRVIEPLWKIPDAAEECWDPLLDGNFIRSTGSVLVRRAAIDAAGGWDKTLRGNEDWDLWLRLAEGNTPFVRVSEPLFQYRVHSANTSSNNDLMRQTGLRVYQKQMDRHRSDPARYAAIRRRYEGCFPPGEAPLDPHAPKPLTPPAPLNQPPPSVAYPPPESRRHRLLRRALEVTGIAALYRMTPLDLRRRVRALFGVDPYA